MFLSLEKVSESAKKIGGESHGCQYIQLPYNCHLDQEYRMKNQTYEQEQISIL